MEYDPALVQWMRENTEECCVTKPELVAAPAENRVPDELTEDQKVDLLALVEMQRR